MAMDKAGSLGDDGATKDIISITAVILCFIILAVPLIFDRTLFDQWELPKATFLWLASGVALLTWVGCFLFDKKRRLVSVRALPLAVAFFISAALSTALSVEPLRSLYGDIGRHEGFITFASYMVLFFLASQALSSANGRRLLIDVTAVASLTISIYGLLQFLGIDFIAWPSGRFEAYRSFSTMGNPMFLGEFLALTMPILVGGFFAVRGKERLLVGAASVVTTLCLITTFTRGSWLGGLVGLLVTCALLYRRVWSQRWVAVVAAMAFVIFLAVGVGLSALGKHPTGEIVSRLASTFSASNGSGATRLEIWKTSAMMTAARPFIGWGPDTYRLVFPKFSTLQHYRLAGRNIVADNAHNYPLQLAVTNGLLGLALFASVMVIVLVGARKTLPSLQDQTLVAGLVGGAVGYLVALLFGISIVAGTALFWVILGSLAGDPGKPVDLAPARFSYTAQRLVFTAMVALTIALSIFLFKPYQADHYYAAALQAAEKKRPVAVVDSLFTSAFELAPYEEQYLLGSGLYYSSLAKTLRSEDFYLKAADRFFLTQKASPRETNGYTFLATTFLDLADMTGNGEYRESAVEQLLTEIELAPNFVPGYYLIGSAYRDLGDYKSALSYYKKAVEKDPAYAEAWLGLARSYEALHETSMAKAAYREAERLSGAR